MAQTAVETIGAPFSATPAVGRADVDDPHPETVSTWDLRSLTARVRANPAQMAEANTPDPADHLINDTSKYIGPAHRFNLSFH
jgi:hypothetical protein